MAQSASPSRRKLAALAAALGLVTAPASAAPLGQSDDLLAEARWSHRLLLICAAGDVALGTQLEMDPFEQIAQFDQIDWPGYADRDLAVIVVSPGASAVVSMGDPATQNAPAVHIRETPDPALETAASCQAGPPGITLIGKDGGVKRRWPGPVSNAALFALIDAMPMRAREMRERPAPAHLTSGPEGPQ